LGVLFLLGHSLLSFVRRKKWVGVWIIVLFLIIYFIFHLK
jgi:hypothetical protein